MNQIKNKQVELLIFLAIVAVVMVYAWSTNHVWEDYYITYKHSKNLATGVGLQYHSSERVHGFTSPIGTLIPAFIAWVLNPASDQTVLWLFRVVSSFFLAGTGVLLFKLARNLGASTELAIIPVFLLAFDSKSVDFSINGMETAFLLFFIVLSIYQLSKKQLRPIALGLAWAGVMWSRPDGCIYIAAMTASFFFFTNKGERLLFAKNILLAACTCAVFYLPWFLWAWSYFGTPVPHTIIAKGGSGSLESLFIKALNLPLKLIPGMVTIPYPGQRAIENIHLFLFAPAYLGSIPTAIFSAVLTGSVLAFLLFTRKNAEVSNDENTAPRAIALTGVVVALYLYFIPRAFPWYIPGCSVLFFATFPFVIAWFERKWNAKTVKIFVGFGLVCQIAIFAIWTTHARLRQIIVEDGHRKQIGLWLKENASPDSTVFLECLGYIGYFSELRMYDFPGLVSPEVVAARKRTDGTMASVIKELSPDYLVLRPSEYSDIKSAIPEFLNNNYEFHKVFSVEETIKEFPWIPWVALLEFDSKFAIVKKKQK